MKRKKNKDLRVVQEVEDPTDKLVEELIKELNDEDNPEAEMIEAAKRLRHEQRRNLIIGVFVLLLAVIGIYLLINLQTYTTARVSDVYPISGAGNNSYLQFEDGVLKYSRDGISYLNKKGEEEWNQSYQIKTPDVVLGHSSAVVYDRSGNDIMVLQKDGVKGEFETNMPIERISVSGQGIVGAILKNGESAMVMCYDAKGNIIVEHKTSLSGTGYPMDVAMSDDGKTMQVLYLYTQEGKITSKVIYYNFGEAGEEETDHQVLEKQYENTIMASGFYMDDMTSVAIGDNQMSIFQGNDKPKETASVKIDKEIKSVFHSDQYIGFVLKNKNSSGYELRLYNTNGKQVMSEKFDGTYDHVKYADDQIIMYDGKKCSIYKKNGIHKFEGSMDNKILEILPVPGVNKYIVISTDGMEKVRLVK